MNGIGGSVQALSVTDVNRYIKALIASDEILSSVAVRGEISNFKRHSAGHLYFTLKDDGGEIAAIMFRGDAAKMNFNLADGMRVVIFGNIDVYEKSGRYQLYARTVIADGIGAMAQAFERLKKKLEAEGLFAEERKRPLPRFPKKIGVITAPTGAAVRDILNITGRRYPQAEILLYPSLVQGADAPASLRSGVEYLNADGSCDVIILGRGGGSIEDLWAFNDEALARAVAASEIPIISAVGHETDFTLCDFVADRRAPTPSAAAEIAVPDRAELLRQLVDTDKAIVKHTLTALEKRKYAVGSMSDALAMRSPEQRLARLREQLTFKADKANDLIDKLLEKRRSQHGQLAEKLCALNPMAVLQRGYGAVKDTDGRIVGRASDMKVGQEVILVMADGEAQARINSVKFNEESNGGGKNAR